MGRQIFELHFNPKSKEHPSFDTFIFEPENQLEKKLGSLYMAGEIKNPLPKSKQLLQDVAKTIKKSFYGLALKTSEKAFSQTLKKTNEFLGEEVKKENISWLGNMDFAALSIKENDLIFTKTGDVKILLVRNKKITDIAKNLSIEGVEPYPLKIFLNIASGKLAQNDIILVLGNNVFEFLKEKGILAQIAKTEDIDPKKIKQLLPQQLFTKGDGSKISGFALIILLNNKEKNSSPLSIFFQKKEDLKPSFLSKIKIARPFKILIKKIKFKTPKKEKPSLKIKKSFSPIKWSPFKSPVLEKFNKSSIIKSKREILLVAGFIILIFAGSFLFKSSDNKRDKEIQTIFQQIEQKANQAESLLTVNQEKEADKILKEIFNQLSPLSQEESSIKQNILSLKNSVQDKLEEINKLEKIIDPIIFVDLTEQEINFIPEKISAFGNDIYLYKELNNSAYKINTQNKSISITNLPDNTKSINSNSNILLAFAPNNTIGYFQRDGWQETKLSLPNFSFNLDVFSSYLSHIYFIDKQTCDIVRYPYIGNFKWGAPQKWNKTTEKNCPTPISSTIDGSIWILNQNNTITRYYTGEFEENISFDIFPFVENITKIQTNASFDNIYLLEPANNRIIIIDKTGHLIKQIQSDKFDDLKSFTISANGKIIYLLNGLKIYKLEI